MAQVPRQSKGPSGYRHSRSRGSEDDQTPSFSILGLCHTVLSGGLHPHCSFPPRPSQLSNLVERKHLFPDIPTKCAELTLPQHAPVWVLRPSLTRHVGFSLAQCGFSCLWSQKVESGPPKPCRHRNLVLSLEERMNAGRGRARNRNVSCQDTHPRKDITSS